jgi:RNA polymerase sigma-70 factor (ECF subfamily)
MRTVAEKNRMAAQASNPHAQPGDKRNPGGETRDSRDDAQLLAAIAQSRDQSALDEMLRRFERQAYNVACHITGHSDVAEEVVQDAMMRVWASAGAYRGEGQVRSWVLSIVARESIHRLRAHKRKLAKMESTFLAAPDERSPFQSAESSELAEALRREFCRLPDLERQLVGLRFAAEMTQEEISQALSIPQQTVSYRINETLKRLRANLAAAGFAAAVPLLATRAFGEALCTGLDAPPELRTRILNQCAKSSPHSRRTKQPLRPATTPSVLWLIAGFLIAAAAAALLWFGNSKPTPVPPAAAPAGLPHADWRHTWNFAQPPTPDLEIMDWKWNAETKSLDAVTHAFLFPKYPLPAGPLVFTAIGETLDEGHMFSGNAFILEPTDKKPEQITPTREWKKSIRLTPGTITIRQYVYHGRIVATVNDQLASMCEYPVNFDEKLILFGFDNFKLHELSVHPVDEQEFPDVAKYPEATVKEMKPVNPKTGEP